MGRPGTVSARDSLEGPVALVGYMGCGKSTVGRRLARDLGWEFVDLDREVSERAGRPIPGIFEEFGEPHFREMEHAALRDALGGGPHVVASCGGGVVLDPRNRDLLRGASTVFLCEDLEVLYRRTRGAGRPLRSASREEFEDRYIKRLPYYKEVAGLQIYANGRPSKRLAREIARWLNG